jgi:hypothetical protein
MTPSPSIDHNKLIAAAAKQVLAPLGLKRDGKSRLWYDDHGWWCTVVEFQPSSWSKGTYLNVGVSWLLFEKAHWTFDVGHREHGFSPAGAEQQFTDALAAMIARATERVQDYRGLFGTVQSAATYFNSAQLQSQWDHYHAGVISALAGDTSSARKHFETLIAQPREHHGNSVFIIARSTCFVCSTRLINSSTLSLASSFELEHSFFLRTNNRTTSALQCIRRAHLHGNVCKLDFPVHAPNLMKAVRRPLLAQKAKIDLPAENNSAHALRTSLFEI